ncbi:MAG: hypothetical protein U5L96_15135 [Owenweeksia sp.]|nr:hypothetical protein [Owenweeksia sp.]
MLNFGSDNFLKIKSRSTEFSKTSAVIDMTKSFIEHDLHADGEVDRARDIDLLNRSKAFFKENDHFDHEQFSQQVFEDQNIGSRFREYSRERDIYDLDVEESFAISAEAVKKKQRVFKSVLKLDKNFHVYIHGNREKIEKGTDEQGRKYYKLYYEEEN